MLFSKYIKTSVTGFLLLTTMLLNSCEEVIEIDLNSSDPKLAIDGTIELGQTAKVRLSYTRDYFSDEEAEYENNATVTITSTLGLSETLTNKGGGLYESNLVKGSKNEQYEMSITLDGKTISASSLMMIPAEIVNLNYSPFDGFGGSEDEQRYNLDIVLKNDPKNGAFFLIKYFLNDDTKEETYSTISHEYFPKDEVIEISPMRFTFTEDDKVTVKAYSIDEGTYDYYSSLDDIIDPHGGSTPYNPESNFGKDVLGYFRAWSTDQQSIEVKDEE